MQRRHELAHIGDQARLEQLPRSRHPHPPARRLPFELPREFCLDREDALDQDLRNDGATNREKRLTAMERIGCEFPETPAPGDKRRQNFPQLRPPFESLPIVGKWLSKAISQKDWTVVEVAEKSGVSQATIYNLQNGRGAEQEPHATAGSRAGA
jgi:hypothetical protein